MSSDAKNQESYVSQSTAAAGTPPVGYPTKEAPPQEFVKQRKTKSRGDGFWKGCCAALCCCCVLDACF